MGACSLRLPLTHPPEAQTPAKPGCNPSKPACGWQTWRPRYFRPHQLTYSGSEPCLPSLPFCDPVAVHHGRGCNMCLCVHPSPFPMPFLLPLHLPLGLNHHHTALPHRQHSNDSSVGSAAALGSVPWALYRVERQASRRFAPNPVSLELSTAFLTSRLSARLRWTSWESWGALWRTAARGVETLPP